MNEKSIEPAAGCIFWGQSYPDPGPQDGIDDATIDRIPMPYPARGKTVDGIVFFPRETFTTRDQAVHYCYVHDSPREFDDMSDHRQKYDRRYYRVEPAGDRWQVWTSRYARQNVDLPVPVGVE